MVDWLTLVTTCVTPSPGCVTPHRHVARTFQSARDEQSAVRAKRDHKCPLFVKRPGKKRAAGGPTRQIDQVNPNIGPRLRPVCHGQRITIRRQINSAEASTQIKRRQKPGRAQMIAQDLAPRRNVSTSRPASCTMSTRFEAGMKVRRPAGGQSPNTTTARRGKRTNDQTGGTNYKCKSSAAREHTRPLDPCLACPN